MTTRVAATENQSEATDPQTDLQTDLPAYPPASASLEAARRQIGPATKGKIKVLRRFAFGVPMWRVEANLLQSEGPDFELEIEGDSLDECAYQLVDAIDKLGIGQL